MGLGVIVARTNTYTALGTYLAALPGTTSRTLLTLAEIEDLLGRALPPSAHHVSFWTARANTGVGRALRSAGFHADLIVTDSSLAVMFSRRTPPLTDQTYADDPGTRGRDASVRPPSAPPARSPATVP